MPLNTPRGYPYPLYTDAATPVPQIGNFATAVDTDVQAQAARITAALNRPSVRVTATANQSITANTDTFATFATEVYDNDSMGNLGVNNDRITFTTAGIYLVTAEVNFVQNGNATTNGRRIVLVHSTLNEVAWTSRRGAQTIDTEETLAYLIQVPAATFIRVQVRHNSGAAVNISARSLSASRVA